MEGVRTWWTKRSSPPPLGVMKPNLRPSTHISNSFVHRKSERDASDSRELNGVYGSVAQRTPWWHRTT